MYLSVIKYFSPPSLGPFEPFGFLVSLACLTALWLSIREARRSRFDNLFIAWLATWIICFGLLGGRVFHCFVYRWAEYQKHPWEFFYFWDGGLSSFGGFLFVLCVLIYFKVRRGLPLLVISDMLILPFFCAWSVARTGCFLVHDHPGRVSDFFLASEMSIRLPEAARNVIQARHDLGLYEVFLSFVILAVLKWGRSRQMFDGFGISLSLLIYGSIRFMLDFLRSVDLAQSDLRWHGLTPAQWGCMPMVLAGLVIFLTKYSRVP